MPKQVDVKISNPMPEIPVEALAVLAEISHEINSSLNLDQVLASAAQQIRRLMEFEIFAVLLPEATTNDLYVRFAIGHRPEVIEHWRIPVGDGIVGAADGPKPREVLKRPDWISEIEETMR